MSYVAGVLIELGATIFQNVGLNLQKLAHHKQLMAEHEHNIYRSTKETPNYCRNWRWWIAILVFLIGVIADFVALAFIPCTVSLPVGSFGLIVSAVCARLWLHERFKLLEAVGTVLIIAGSCCVVFFSYIDLDLLTVESFSRKFTDDIGPLIFFCVTGGVWAGALVLSYFVKNAVTYAIVPGLTGVFTVLLGGVIGQLTLNSIQGNNQMNTWEYWVTLLGLIVAILVLNNYLQRALGAYDNMIVTPIYFTCVLLVSVLSGILFFKYFEDISVLDGAFFGAGIVLIIVGCVLLSIKHIG